MISLFKKKKTVVVHDGRFHADEIFACAFLFLYYNKKISIVRTRKPELIESADIVLDVGGVYDHSIFRYDHHQKEGAGLHESTIPYASCGLIWKHYGHALVKSDFVWRSINSKIVEGIDAGDNGISISQEKFEDVHSYTIHNIIGTRLPSWEEEGKIDLDREFMNLVIFAADLVKREIEKSASLERAQAYLKRDYERSQNKQIIVLSKRYPFEALLPEYPEPLFVIYQGTNGLWRTEGVPVKKNEFFNRRMYLPKKWAGLRDGALEYASSVKGAIFCHRDLFMCVSETKDTAMNMAILALQEHNINKD